MDDSLSAAASRFRSSDADPLPAIVLCGGQGRRLGGTVEKPLVEVDGEPMVDRVIQALRTAKAVDRIHLVASPAVPNTLAHLGKRADSGKQANSKADGLVVYEGAGDGYVADLDAALDRTGTPALTVAADLPLLTATAVEAAVERASGESLSVCVPVGLKLELGISAETTFDQAGLEVAPTGVNVVGETSDQVWVVDDESLAVNVNRPRDLAVAREMAASAGK